MTIDKDGLKSIALMATKSRWCTDGLNEVMSAESDQLNDGYIIADCQGPDRLKNAKYLAAASPAVVLELLGQIEHLEQHNAELLGDIAQVEVRRDELSEENDRFRRYCEVLEGDKKALTETHVLYTWLRKKCDEPSNDVVAVHMNIGHDWAKVTDLDRDLRTMIDREEP